MTSSPTSTAGTAYTAHSTTVGWRASTFSTGAAAKFSPSTRSQSELRPAK